MKTVSALTLIAALGLAVPAYAQTPADLHQDVQQDNQQIHQDNQAIRHDDKEIVKDKTAQTGDKVTGNTAAANAERQDIAQTEHAKAKTQTHKAHAKAKKHVAEKKLNTETK